MARTRNNALPTYVELNPRNQTYYYRNPAMPAKAKLGKVEQALAAGQTPPPVAT